MQEEWHTTYADGLRRRWQTLSGLTGLLGDDVRAGDVYSSGMRKVVDITKRRCDRLLVLDLAGQNHGRADVMAIVPKKKPLVNSDLLRIELRSGPSNGFLGIAKRYNFVYYQPAHRVRCIAVPTPVAIARPEPEFRLYFLSLSENDTS